MASTDLVIATLPDSDLDPDGTTRTAATITAAILGFKILGPFGALAGATFANHYGKIHTYTCLRYIILFSIVLELSFIFFYTYIFVDCQPFYIV